MTRTDHCPQCGGFIGDAGCKSPRHKYSAELTALLKSKPREITVAEFDNALKEKFYVNTATAGVRVGFGNRLLIHMSHHSAADQRRRKVHLLYAVAAVKSGKRGRNPQGGPGSYAYAKRFSWGKMLVLTDQNGDVEDTFDIIPKKKRTLPKDRCAGSVGIYSPTSPPSSQKEAKHPTKSMSGQPHGRSPRVSVLSDNPSAQPRNMDGCASDGELTTSNAAPLIVSSPDSIPHPAADAQGGKTA